MHWLDRTTAKNAIVPAIDHPSKKEMVEQQRFRTQIIEMKKEVARPRGRFQNSELIRLERVGSIPTAPTRIPMFFELSPANGPRIVLRGLYCTTRALSNE